MSDGRPTDAAPERAIPTRRVSFEDHLADLPKHFAAHDDLVMSHIMAVLSGLFPDGEDFFVRTVRHYRDEITDSELKRDVAGFIGQEATHGREHRALNRRLAELGYPTLRIERFTEKGLAFRERVMSPAANLAATAALEHFTAALAETILEDPEARALIGDNEVRKLFLWHALEESEHKAVAFDVYRTVGGSERTRVVTMKFLRFAFVFGNVVEVGLSLLQDPAARERGRLRASLRRLRDNPFLTRAMWRRLKDYDRADFHPSDHDSTEIVARWRAELFGDDGELSDHLVGAA